MASEGGARAAPRDAELTAAQAGRAGLALVGELTGKQAESVAGVEPTEEGWLVTVDVVEERRIPSSADVLASYEADLAPDGDLIAYRRVRRYARGHGTRGE